MRLASVLALLASLIAAACAATGPGPNGYHEHLHLKPLPGGALYAGFNFSASIPLQDYDNQHFRFFPRSLGQILHFTHTAELHLRFALGRWDEENWGNRPRRGRREGGTGVELWAWLEGVDRREAEERWSGLVNSLSGLFCASLNFVDATKTIQPILSFEREGTTQSHSPGLYLMHGMLPHEVVCTENLTPFLKLLPCKGKTGVSSLLDGHKVFDANWQTMAVDVKSSGTSLELEQTVDMVLDIERSMRPRDNPIPRPPPIEEIACDDSKSYNAHDTCYPKRPEGEAEWSLSRIFGRPIRGSCPLAGRQDTIDVLLEVPASRQVEVIGDSALQTVHQDVSGSRLYRLKDGADFDLKLPQQVVEQYQHRSQPLLRASRQITGYGQERGGMHTVITNQFPTARRVVYLESLPWFLRPYMHTLRVEGANIQKMYYKPAVDRKKGTHLELLLEIPAFSEVELAYDFEKAILRYTEYPPDANRGFDVAPAVLRVLSQDGGEDSYLRTTSLLLPLPTPDFSMPYNVIILTSTVIALGFGSMFNLLVRRFVLVEEVPKSPLAEGIKGFAAKVRAGLRKGKALPGAGGKETSAPQSPELAAAASGLQLDRGLGSIHARERGSRVANGKPSEQAENDG